MLVSAPEDGPTVRQRSLHGGEPDPVGTDELAIETAAEPLGEPAFASPPPDTEPDATMEQISAVEPVPLVPVPGPIDAPPTAPAHLLAPEAAAAAASSVDGLLRMLAASRSTQTHRGGPTIEDLVREEIRPLLKVWLDSHLPGLVERQVRAEIERLVGRAVS